MSDKPTVSENQQERPAVEIKKVDVAEQPSPTPLPEVSNQKPPTQETSAAQSGWVTDLPSIDNLYNFGMAQPDRDRLIAQQLLFGQFLREHARRVLADHKIEAILDIGCADGQVTRTFSLIYPKARVVGLDKDAGAIETAKKNQALAADAYKSVDAYKSIEFVVGDAEGPLPDGPFDLIYSSHTMLYVPNYRKSLQEMFRVLRPGGYVWIKDFDTHLATAIENNANYARYMSLVHATMLKAGLNVFFATELFKLLPETGFENVRRIEEKYPLGDDTVNSRIATSIMLGGIFNIRNLVAKTMNIPVEDVVKMHQEIVRDSATATGSFAPANIVAQKPL